VIGRSPIGYVVRIDGAEITLNVLDHHRGMVAGHSHGVSMVAEIGSLLGVDAGDRLLLLRVRSISFAEPNEVHRRSMGKSSLSAEPLRHVVGIVVGKLTRKSGEFEFVSDSLSTPALGAMVYPLIADEEKTVLGRDDNAPTSIHLGNELRSGAPVHVDIQSLISKHVAVLGSSGQGKSCFTAAILQQIVKLPGSRTVIFDINGEYEQAFSENVEPGWVRTTKLGEGGLKIPYFALGRHGLQRLLMPSEKTQRPALMFALESLNRVKWIDAGSGVGISTDTTPFLFDDCRSGDATQAQRRISALQDKTAAEVSMWPPMKALGPLVAESYSLTNGRSGWERNAFQYGNVAPLVNRIHRFVEDPMFSAVVDTDGAPRKEPLDWRSEASELVANIFGDEHSNWRIHIVDLRRVAHDLMPFILGSLLELFAFEIFERGQDKKVPTLLVLEEAHHYLRPVGVGESDTGSSLAYERLAKEGRKFGLALWLSTQRPSEISQTVLSQCGNWISFRLASDRDLAAVQASSEWADRRDVKRISGLARQNAVAFGVGLRMPVSLIAPTALLTPKFSDAPFDKWADSSEDLGLKV